MCIISHQNVTTDDSSVAAESKHTLASLELSQTLKKISHAEQTSPEKYSICTFGSGADEIFDMYSTTASQNFDTAKTHDTKQ